MVVLQPLEELFEAIAWLSHFVVPACHLLTENASRNALSGNWSGGSCRGKKNLMTAFWTRRKYSVPIPCVRMY
jgi:hypothetical protein